MPDDATTRRFETLLSEHLDGHLDEDGRREFLALLHSEPAFTEMLREQLMMDARLAQFESESHGAERFVGTMAATLAAETDGEAFIERVMERAVAEASSRVDAGTSGGNPTLVAVESSAPARPRWWRRISVAAAAALVLGMFLGGGFWWWQGPQAQSVEPVVARFGALRDCRWVTPDTRIQSGDAITRGQRIELSSGSAEVLFNTGARLTVIGPAIIEPRTGNSAFLTLGEVKLVAETPESKGFTLETPNSQFVDIGTAFTARVSPDGLSHLEVTEGEVDVVVEGVADTRRLRAGETLYVEPGKRKVVTRIESGDGTAAFRFPTIEPPSSEDYADQTLGHATIRVAQGELKHQPGRSGPAEVLLDGKGQPRQDSPHQSAFFQDNSGGSFLVDLGKAISITRINSYSWHQHNLIVDHRTRAQQRFTLYGFSGDKVPDLSLPPDEAGWIRIARVNSDRFFRVNKTLDRPAQQACSIMAADGDIGRFRYLLWEVKRNTFFGEFDVFGAP